MFQARCKEEIDEPNEMKSMLIPCNGEKRIIQQRKKKHEGIKERDVIDK